MMLGTAPNFKPLCCTEVEVERGPLSPPLEVEVGLALLPPSLGEVEGAEGEEEE